MLLQFSFLHLHEYLFQTSGLSDFPHMSVCHSLVFHHVTTGVAILAGTTFRGTPELVNNFLQKHSMVKGGFLPNLLTQRAQWDLNKIEITLNGTFAG